MGYLNAARTQSRLESLRFWTRDRHAWARQAAPTTILPAAVHQPAPRPSRLSKPNPRGRAAMRRALCCTSVAKEAIGPLQRSEGRTILTSDGGRRPEGHRDAVHINGLASRWAVRVRLGAPDVATAVASFGGFRGVVGSRQYAVLIAQCTSDRGQPDASRR